MKPEKNPPRHPECESCRFYRRPRENPICAGCGVGEFFEERVQVRVTPPDHELFRLYAEMTRDNGDE